MAIRSRRRRVASLLAIALLSVFGLALAEDAFFHTDDGCQVEVHCLACRLALGTAAGAVAPDVAPNLTASDRPAPYRGSAAVAPADLPKASRAPPLT
jgi:hypothetical protein